jgi:RNA polymerase sigma-70 factor (ECF subfamily)
MDLLVEAGACKRLEVPLVTAGSMGDEDQILIARYKHGDQAAFNALFHRHYRRIFALCYHILGNREDAEDACQEAFVKAHRALKSFRGDSRFLTWITRIAVNVCRSETRRAWRKYVSSLDDDDAPVPVEPTVDVPEELAQRAERAEIRRIISELPDRFRLALVLRHFQEMSYEEIAETMGWSIPQTKATIFRARQAFKERYQALLGQENGVS